MNQRLWTTLAPVRRCLAVLAALSMPLGAATPAKAQGPTPISSCPTTITRPGRYILTADCSVGPGLTGITITAPNVQLDLNGHTLTGPNDGTGIGIAVSGDGTPPMVRAAVSNGTIQQFQTGVLLMNARASSLTSLTVNNNSSFGIDLESSHNCLVSGNSLTGNGTSTGNCGILVGNGSTHNTVESNVVNGNRAGIRLQNGGTGNSIQGNTANDNFGSGIRLDVDSNGNSVQANTTNGNATGISLVATAGGNLISGNTAQGNTSGIDVAGDNNTIQNNNASNNIFAGIVLGTAASGNTISTNQTISNTIVGMDVAGDNNTIQNNTANSNTNTGIVIRPEASGNTVSTNQASNNGSASVFGNGIDLQGPSNFIQRNTLNGNTNAGILLRAGGNGTIVSENQAGGNGGAGIDVDVGSTAYTIGGNTLNTNLIGILVRSTAIGNALAGNIAQLNDTVDLQDDNAPSNGTCPNRWTDNIFATKGGAGEECIS